jgi:D-aminopeptidase
MILNMFAIDTVQTAGITNVVIEMRNFGESETPAKVRLILGKPQKYKIMYQGGLKIVPMEEDD